MTHGIVLTRNGIYHHRNQNKVGGRINQSNDTIRKLTSQMAKLNFNTNKSKDRNVRLRL
jgi:hypothetical protein